MAFTLAGCLGDCREILPRLIAEGVRVQTCVTSPPYWGLRDYGVEGQIGFESTPEEYAATMVKVFGLVRQMLADDGTLWLNLGDSYAGGVVPTGLKPKDLIGIPWRVAFALQADGWYLRSDIIWHKPNPMPESVRDRPTKSHEYLFLLSKSERYFYDADAIAEESVSEGPRLADDDEPTRHGTAGARASGVTRLGAGATRNRRTVWTVATQPYSGAHFATFPPELIEPCILAGSRPGDIVLDPFLGSGTTAEVAQHLGRRWIGIDLNPSYLPMQHRRTAQTAFALAAS
jgi:DNA modification methylase